MDESDHIREGFARYGKAMFYAQVLEHGVVNTIVTVRLALSETPVTMSRTEWERMVDGLFEVHFEKTIGQLLHVLRPLVHVSDALERLLSQALRARNYLAHSYFRERVEESTSHEGREAMIAEVDTYADMFIEADRLLEEALRPF